MIRVHLVTSVPLMHSFNINFKLIFNIYSNRFGSHSPDSKMCIYKIYFITFFLRTH